MPPGPRPLTHTNLQILNNSSRPNEKLTLVSYDAPESALQVATSIPTRGSTVVKRGVLHEPDHSRFREPAGLDHRTPYVMML